MDALGGNVISMTQYPSDLLNVLWLWKWSERTDGGNPRDAELRLPIIPLFETIADLRNAPEHPGRRARATQSIAIGFARRATDKS